MGKIVLSPCLLQYMNSFQASDPVLQMVWSFPKDEEAGCINSHQKLFAMW